MTRTKKFRLASLITSFISLLLSFGPLAIYSVLAFTSKTASTTDKITLMSMLTVGVILSVVCLINKYTPRCRTWLIMIGLYLCLDKFIGCVMVMAITQCLDELVVRPLAKSLRGRYVINREIDKRTTP